MGRQLPDAIELCSIQLPGSENRIAHQPFTQWQPLIKALTTVLLPYLDRPFTFLGYSMGALLSFELARHLRRSTTLQPVHLHVAAHRAPHLVDQEPPLHTLPHDEFIQELRRLNGTPDDVLAHAELMELLLPLLRADFAVCETYQYPDEARLTSSITALGGADDSCVSPSDLAAWAIHTQGPFKQ